MAINDLNSGFDRDAAEFRARSNWQEMKGKIRKQYGNLTDDDLEYSSGQQEEWLGKLGNKIGKTAQDVRSWISGL
jgi:uncharacterized protein YjbJ (UPF0337 family)